MSPPATRRARFAALTAGCAAAVAAVGLLVLAGWVADVAALRGPVPGAIEMKANTALGFVLAGAALWLLACGPAEGLRRSAGRVCALAVLMIGALTLVQYVAGVDLGFDELLFEDVPGATMTVDPGRLAPQTALGFTLIGTALLLLGTPAGTPRRMQGLAIVTAALALVALLGYMYGADPFQGLPAFSPMAVHTAFAMLVLSIGVVCTEPDRGVVAAFLGPTPGAVIARRLFPLVIFALPALGLFRLAGELAGLYDPDTGNALMIVAFIAILSAGLLAATRLIDRTEQARMRTEAARRDLAAIVESSGDAIVSADLDGAITSWNRGAERLYGFTAAEAIGRNRSILVPPARAAEGAGLFARVLAGETVSDFETVRRRKDGSEIDVSISLSPMQDAAGRIVGASSIGRDISERKRAEAALVAAKEEADRASNAKSDFLSRVSHELRTPLAGVLGFGELLKMGELDRAQRESVDHILRAGQHLLVLIDELLDLSRIDAGTMKVSIEPLDPTDVIREAVAVARALGDRRGINVEADLGEPGDVRVLADPQRLEQVLMNLLSNAVKYNRDEGSVRVSVSADDGMVRIAVQDTGPGLTRRQRARLFTPFERLGAESTTTSGTGLGLALARGLVDAMGGSLGVTSEPGKGSCFWVKLRAAPAPEGRTRRRAQWGSRATAPSS